jgi:hypothetical protein
MDECRRILSRRRVQMQPFQNIMTRIESPNSLPEEIHWRSRQQNRNGNTPTHKKHVLCPSTRNPIVEKVGKAEKHKVFECDRGDKGFHGDGTVGIEHVGEAGVHVDDESPDRETVKHSGDNEALSGIDSETETVETDTRENDRRSRKVETEFRLFVRFVRITGVIPRKHHYYDGRPKSQRGQK